MMMTTKIKISIAYIVTDLFLIIVSLFMGNLWIINTQVAFICSMLIVFASFFSYKSMVDKRLHAGDIGDDRDLLDSIDDKYELYDDDANEISNEEFKKVYKEERAKTTGIKKSFINLLQSWSGALSLFRIISYGILFISILLLIKKELFEPIAFLVGIGAIPVSSLLISFLIKND